MKRINLTVDLEDNKLFDKTITKAVENYAKQIARGVIQRAMESEINRIVQNRLSDWTVNRSNNSLRVIIDTKVDHEVNKKLKSFEISEDELDSIIKEKIEGLCVTAIHRRIESMDIEKLTKTEIEHILPKVVFDVLRGDDQ